MYSTGMSFALVDLRTNKVLITSNKKDILVELLHSTYNKFYDLGCYTIICERN